MSFYKGFGLIFRSELELPQLSIVHDVQVDSSKVVDIHFADLTELKDRLNNHPDDQKWYQMIDEGCFFINIKDVASYLVCHGSQIIVDPYEGADEDSIRLFLLGSAIGALLQQRDYLVMHGSAVLSAGEGTLFVAPMGVGKSTLAAALVNKGFHFLCDDVCAIKVTDDHIHAYPSYQYIKLWQHAADKLQMSTDGHSRIRPQDDKFYMPNTHQWYDTPVQLKRIVVLNEDDRDDFELQDIVGVEKIIHLKYHTYRYFFLKELQKETHHFKMYEKLLNKLPIHLLKRPKEGFKINELADFVAENVLQSKPLGETQ